MKKYLFFFFTLFFIQVYSENKTVCLNMIVKNESKVIERCLGSVKDFINYWVIVDTGSTDGTQQIIKNFMKDVPGELHQSEWQNFEYNRNEALQFAKNKGDYILFMDADDQLLFPSDYKWPELDKDFYYVQFNHSGTKYNKMQLINNKLEWKWTGVLHEYISCPNASTHDMLNGLVMLEKREGARSQDPQKYFKDALILEKEVEKDPSNTRNVFYLAQSYGDSGQYEKAINTYEKRIEMGGGYEQEIFWSMYKIGVLQEQNNMPPEVFLKSYARAYLRFPDRAEPINRMALYYRKVKDFQKGYDLTKLAMGLSFPQNGIFVEEWVYSYNLVFECSIDAYWIGKYEESKKLSESLLQKADLPENVRSCVINNIKWANIMIESSNKTALNNLLNSYNEQLVKAEEPKVEKNEAKKISFFDKLKKTCNIF